MPHNFIKIICGKKCSIVENVLLYIVFLYIDFHCWDQEKSSSYPFVVIMILCLLFRNTVRVLTAIYCRPTFRLCSMSPNEEDERRHPAVSLFVYSSQKSCITEEQLFTTVYETYIAVLPRYNECQWRIQIRFCILISLYRGLLKCISLCQVKTFIMNNH